MKTKLNLALINKLENNEELKEKIENIKKAVVIKNMALLFARITFLNFILAACCFVVMYENPLFSEKSHWFLVGFLSAALVLSDLVLKFKNFSNFLELNDFNFENIMCSTQEITNFFEKMNSFKHNIRSATLLLPMVHARKVILSIKEADRTFKETQDQPLDEEEIKELNELLSFLNNEEKKKIFEQYLEIKNETWQISHKSAFKMIQWAEDKILKIEKENMANKIITKK